MVLTTGLVGLIGVGWFLWPAAEFISYLFGHGVGSLVWPDRGEFADLALDEGASLVIADFRSHVLDESKHAKYMPLKNEGRIIEIPKSADAEILDRCVVKEGRTRRDIPATPGHGRLDDGEIAMFQIRVASGPKKGIVGWLPEGDLTGKYPMP